MHETTLCYGCALLVLLFIYLCDLYLREGKTLTRTACSFVFCTNTLGAGYSGRFGLGLGWAVGLVFST